MESTPGYTFAIFVRYFTSTGIDTRQKGIMAFSVSSVNHRQSLVKKIAKV